MVLTMTCSMWMKTWRTRSLNSMVDRRGSMGTIVVKMPASSTTGRTDFCSEKGMRISVQSFMIS